MVLSIEELQGMSPIEAEYVHAYMREFYREKVTPDTTNYEDLNASTGYASLKENTLADINQIHPMLGEVNKKKHGISICHLPGYLNWLIFCKQLKYRIDGKRRKVEFLS